jgi:branched-chain amino acid transport system permease protein
VLALVIAGLAAAALGFATSFLALRGSDLDAVDGDARRCAGVARDRQPVLRAYWRRRRLQGIHAPLLGTFRFDLFGHTAYIYSLIVLFVAFVIARHIVHSLFGLSLR